MLTFRPASSKVCITYSRCPCNRLWRHLECLNIQTIEVNTSSTKQLLNNFLGRFFRKASGIFGARIKDGLFIKKKGVISQALIDMEINHEEYIRILKVKDKYEMMKDNLRSENEKYKIMRLISIKSKT